MKQELAKIYRALARGDITRQDALAQIRTLKYSPQDNAPDTLYASPGWEPAPLNGADGRAALPQTTCHAVFCDLPQMRGAGTLAEQWAEVTYAATGEWADLSQAYTGIALHCFERLQHILGDKQAGAVTLQLVIADGEAGALLTGLSALFATATLENPRVSGQIILVPPSLPADALVACLEAEKRYGQERVVRYVGKQRLAQRWRTLDDAALPVAHSALKEHGVYLITGGFGGLGLLFAHEILTQTRGAQVILTGRSALVDVKPERAALLQRYNGRVSYRQADISEPGQTHALVTELVAQYGRLDGILHSAGSVNDGFILKKDRAQFTAVMRPKVDGAWALESASQELALDFFVLFSSVAAWVGNVGQADYAAANGFLDTFAAYRAARVAAGERCGKTVAIAWPHWADGGMSTDPLSMAAWRQRTGLQSLASAQGMAAFYRCLTLEHNPVMVMSGDAPALLAALQSSHLRALPPATEPVGVPGLGMSLSLTEKTRQFLKHEFSALLKVPVASIDPQTPMERYGINSILAMDLTSLLERHFGTLPKTLFFEYLTVGELADYFVRSHADKLGALLVPAASQAAPAPVAPVTHAHARAGRRRLPGTAPAVAAAPPADAHEAIAIVGLSGRYPEAEDIAEFWRNLREGKDCIVEIPAQRWDWRKYYSTDRTREGAHYSKWGGFIRGVDEFDPRFFNISPREARTIDPQERLFLQHAWNALEDAGLTRAALQIAEDEGLPGQVGVYAGVMYGEYNLSGSLASIANRVSYFLNLHGPSITLDTMCSSSLTALHLACQDLRQGHTRLGIAGGVNVSIHPNKYRMLSGGQFISTEGHCRSFGEGGDGYIPGEGVGVAILKRLSDAERDGNLIYGVIRGSALNHGGKTNGYTVPNPQAQADVIRRALRDAGVVAREVSYLEAHGTGTRLGDPIEVTALTNAFYRGVSPAEREYGFCAMGSAKSNIGHCESAAGIAGLTKVLLQLKHGQIAPSLHSATLNPHIDFSTTPFVVNQALRRWDTSLKDGQPAPRIAGLSSFGAGGANAHLVIAEYRRSAATCVAAPEPVLILLSARTPEQLRQRVSDLLAFIGNENAAPDLRSLAWTLQTGREAMDERLAFVSESVDGLRQSLRRCLTDERAGDGIFRARVTAQKEALAQQSGASDFSATQQRWMAQRDLAALADWWVKGGEPSWRALYGALDTPCLMSLPGYPFARERYWQSSVETPPQAAALHPLVQVNTSSLTEHRYTSRFTGLEPFFASTMAAENRTLPPLLLLEMLRAAAALTTTGPQEKGAWELTQVAWGDEVAAHDLVNIALLARESGELALEVYSGADNDSEKIHGQGLAVFQPQLTTANVDFAALKQSLAPHVGMLPAGVTFCCSGSAPQGGSQLLAGFALAEPDAGAYQLSAQMCAILTGALNAATGFALPELLRQMRCFAPCPERGMVWLRYREPHSVSLDIGDEQGNICIQMAGLACSPASEPAATLLPQCTEHVELPPVATERRPEPPAVAMSKPAQIRLAGAESVAASTAIARTRVTLAPLSALRERASDTPVRLSESAAGVYVIECDAPLAASIKPLLQALEQAQQNTNLSVLRLVGRHPLFWQGDREVCDEAIACGLLHAVAALPYPVVAELPQGATGAGLLLSLVCDFIVGSVEGEYSYTRPEQGLFPGVEETRLFRERLGHAHADNFLCRDDVLSGQQLLARGWRGRMVASARVEAEAAALAAELASRSRQALSLLKTHLNRHMLALVGQLTAVGNAEPLVPAVTDARTSVIHIDSGDASVAGLAQTIDLAGQSGDCAAIVLTSARDGFLPECDNQTLIALKNSIQAAPVPVIAAFTAGAQGTGWLVGLYCDAAVYCQDGHYAAPELWQNAVLARDVAVLSALRIDEAWGWEATLDPQGQSGQALLARSRALYVAPEEEVTPLALRLAAFWSRWSRAKAAAWKQENNAVLARRLALLPEATPAGPCAESNARGRAPSVPAELRSGAVTVTVTPDGVAVVRLQEQTEKNMFSEALITGLKAAFAWIEQTPACRVAVLTGYDSYFATGGTVDTLLAIQNGSARFTDEKIFQQPLACSLPVIAAMQGHAIGGGWSFGMFADSVIFSNESHYLSPYMAYGFTPGAGATLIFPERMGYDLAREILMTAREMTGRELGERGLSQPVVARSETLTAALALAARFAQLPRTVLQSSKRLWAHALRANGDASYRLELAMHGQTFVNNAATLATIQATFSPVAPASSSQPADTLADTPALLAELGVMLAQELFLQAEEIEEDTPFINLGLDSITGVTWVRKINARYGINIEATQVYSHPTLRALGERVASEMAAAGQPVPAAVAAPGAVVASAPSAQAVTEHLKVLLAQELHLNPAEIAQDTPFIDLGLDSITGVTWVRKINAHYGTNIEATKVYSHPTLRELAALVPAVEKTPDLPVATAPGLRKKLTSWRVAGRVAQASAARATAGGSSEPIAVIGMAGQFAQAPDLEAFWGNLAAGKNCISEVDEQRWPWAQFYQPGAASPGKTNSKWLGALADYDCFDPLFFNISPTEAQCMDPQQRLFLQACWHSIENAGYTTRALSASQCAVFVGCGTSDYLQASPEQHSALGFTGAATSILAARIAYFLNLRGPSIAIETACSSSLVAIASACDSLILGNCDLALAGGVYVMAGPAMHVMSAQAGMLSPEGRCYTFDQRADGFVPGEGVGVVMLKRLADAERDGDPIHAVIEGWGVNQDGKTNGITAPNEGAQTQLLQTVYQKFAIDPAQIQLIEAHGTGTKLGDPIEVAGLKKAFAAFTERENFCALGAVKSNIGHCLTAAGVAGFLKLALALRHRALPPTINFATCNEHIQLAGSPFYVNRSLQPWNVAAGERRRAAVSAFGFSGTNAHIVMAEYAPKPRVHATGAVFMQNSKVIIPLSAKTAAQLQQKARALSRFIRERQAELDLLDVAWTLQMGRDAMEERLGLLAGSLAELCDKLDAWLEGDGTQNDIYQGTVKKHREGISLISQDDEIKQVLIGKWLEQRRLSKLLALWAKGLDLDWSMFYAGELPRRIALPGYPFARERYRLAAGSPAAQNQCLAHDMLHPLIHRNDSLLSQQRYRSCFSGTEFFCDVLIDGVRTLSSAGLLEMARAATLLATADLNLPPVTLLHRLRWHQTLPVVNGQEVVSAVSSLEEGGVAFTISASSVAGEVSPTPGLQGEVCFVEPQAPVHRNLAALRAGACVTSLPYAELAQTGVRYGTALRVIQDVMRAPDYLLAHVCLQQGVQNDVGLHPGMIEGALQAAMAFARNEDARLYGPLLPATLATLTMLAACPAEAFVLVRRADDDGESSDEIALDVDIIDAQGDCCVELRGLTLNAVRTSGGNEPETGMMVPVWDPVAKCAREETAGQDERILLIGADESSREQFAAHYAASSLLFVDIGAEDSVEDITGKFSGLTFGRIIWVATAHACDTLAEESIIADQALGVMQVFRIIRALTALQPESQPLRWDLVTLNSLQVMPGDVANPTHAGLHGLSGSMAEVYPHWTIRLLDLPAITTDVLAHLPQVAQQSGCYAFRNGEWFSQKLVRVKDIPERTTGYRPQGVYVAIGGSGGLGEIWTRYLVEHYQANVIWIGRKPLNEDIQRKLDGITPLGKTPEYFQADASNRQALEAVYRQIRQKYPRIHGVVHTAVGDFDQSLKTVSEHDFRKILSVKVDLSVRIAQVFANEQVDFILFFSSNASFVRGGGMSGYSTGCTFKDAFALQLGRVYGRRTKVVNWGYWALGAGEAMTDKMKSYFYDTGYRPLIPEESMGVLERFVSSPLSQLSISRALPGVFQAITGESDRICYYDDPLPGVNLHNSLTKRPVHIHARAGQDMEALLARLLGAILRSPVAVIPSYARWLVESQKIVQAYCPNAGADNVEGMQTLWQEWDNAAARWRQDSGKQALCLLVERCMRALADIVSGKQKATDVLFPQSTLTLVEKVYKTETTALAYNDVLFGALSDVVRLFCEAKPDAPLRLFEIGAGTGGTTEGVISALEPYRENIKEYCYTDLSQAFLFHAEENYVPRAPYICTRLFNVEQPLAEQGLAGGQYDIVIAANAIHATRNIRNALRNVKAILRRGGVLVLNEISDKSLCGHLTFGLLDGWWLNEDADIRIPGSPGLYPQSWQDILQQEGFHSIEFVCPQAHAAGQQIILAVSDGVVRQKTPRAPTALAPAPAKPFTPNALAKPAPASAPVQDAQTFQQKTLHFCSQLISKALRIDSQRIDPDEPLEHYGIDSISIGLVNQELRQYFGEIRSTLLYEFQTVTALSAHLIATQSQTLNALFAQQSSATSAPQPAAMTVVKGRTALQRLPLRPRVDAAPTARRSNKTLAIVGLSGVYPQANNVDEFWENLRVGKDCVTEIPASRWSLAGFYEPEQQKAIEQEKSYCKWGGFVDAFAEFDALFFNIPPREAFNMDPQERMFLQAAWRTLENAGYTRSRLKEQYQSKVGVFAGITRTGYNLYRGSARGGERFWPRTSFSSVANRLSYFLDIHGPSLPVDTMCSSSLTAIHEACEHIRNGDCEMALAGGVNLYLHPTSYVDMSSQRMLSTEGKCKSFGAGGNGFVPGEGVGVVLIKPLERAIADNDMIHGLILASHVNHGGKTNGFTVPNPLAQAELIRTTLDRACISARDVSYFEAHGTGTELGDPIEITGLQQAFAPDSPEQGYCRIGSVKSNIGHLEAAAGIAGVTKVLLQMKHRQIAPSLHAAQLNPHISFSQTPFKVNQTLTDWDNPVCAGSAVPRIAGISSFGAGGANACVLLSEYQPANTACTDVSVDAALPVAVPLSAKTPEQLRQKAGDLLAFLQANVHDLSLNRVAYTLQTGREAMDERVGFIASSVAGLSEQLRAYLDTGESAVSGEIAQSQPGKRLVKWLGGENINWDEGYGREKPRRIALPAYPFARDEYWLNQEASAQTDTEAPQPEKSWNSIEEVVNRLADASLDTEEGIQRLKTLF